MKSVLKFFSFVMTSSLIVACVSAESELLMQARTIQNELLTNVESLDSIMTDKLNVLNEARSEMAMDSTLSLDSLKMQAFLMSKEKIDNISNLQSELTDWSSNLKLLPSVEDMNKGGENPFGEKAKDQEILIEIKKSQEAFNNLKIKSDAAMK